MGYYAKWSKSDREKQIPYDHVYMWYLKNKINEQTNQKQIHGYRGQIDDCQMGGWKKWRDQKNTNCQL